MGSVENQVEKLVNKFEDHKQEGDKSSFNNLTTPKEEVIKDTDVRETALEEGMRQLYIKENIEMKTELSAPLVLHMARGMVYVDTFKSKVMKNFMDNIQILSISKGRKGRQELVALVRNSQEGGYGSSDELQGFSKLMGK